MSKFKELLARAREKSQLAQQKHQLDAQVADIAHKIELNPAQRGENLRLLRAFFNEHQDGFARMLGVCSQSRYSAIETGKSTLDDNEARAIESKLCLCPGWLDRKNIDGLLLSNDELLLIRALKATRPGVVSSIIEMVNNICASRSVPA